MVYVKTLFYRPKSVRQCRVMKKAKQNTRFKRFVKDISIHTPFTKMVILLVILWLAFSTGLYFAERGAEGAAVTTFGDALYWSIAAFSTAGIADAPQSGVAQLVGSYCQDWCLRRRSSGDLIILHYLNTIFKLNSCNHFCQIIKST